MGSVIFSAVLFFNKKKQVKEIRGGVKGCFSEEAANHHVLTRVEETRRGKEGKVCKILHSRD